MPDYYKEQTLNNTPIDKDHLQPLKFQGQFFNPETSLHYNRFRYYDSDVGMFISRDPIGLLGGYNVFQYANNPVMWIDPWGLACKAPNGYKTNDVDRHGNLSPQKNRASGHKNQQSDDYIQSHHPIQDEWAMQNILGYKRNKAPAVLLPSKSGMAHAKITAMQSARRKTSGYGNTLKQEFNTGYKEMIKAGVNPKVAKKAYKNAYKYFDSLREKNVGNTFYDI